MALYVIADLHLSNPPNEDKSMEVFGGRWAGYMQRLEQRWRGLVTDTDTVVVAGDISWALTLPEAEQDLRFLGSLPGQKVLLRGNHDFWWGTTAKIHRFLEDKSIPTIRLLHNNAWLCEPFILCGTRGWFHDPDLDMPPGADYDKIVHREAERLKISLAAASALRESHPDCELLAFLHFPPLWGGRVCAPIADLLAEAGVRRCFFGHIHGVSTLPGPLLYRQMSGHLVTADHLAFLPKLISPLSTSSEF